MTAEQLGRRLGITKQAVLRLEQSEQRGTISLHSLQRAAQALGCKVSYALVPEVSLEEHLRQQAVRVARRKMERVAHSMSLEAQEVGASAQHVQLDELADQLQERLPTELWDEA